MNYKVSVNGRSVELHEATVSAFPFNRVWNGRQRPMEQTETAHFVSFDFSGTAELEIEVFDAEPSLIEIRPFEYGFKPEVSGRHIKLKVSKPAQFVVEVNGKRQALHVFANPPLNYRHGDSEIYFGPGEHHPGVILPKSGQTVCIDEGAVVYGAIFVYKAKDVRITGRGILDASRMPRSEIPSNDSVRACIPALREPQEELSCDECFGQFVAYGCENLIVEGIVLRDSMFWALIVRNNCKNVVVDNVKIIGQWRYNSDGIDICASENVTVRNSFIRSFDDCFVARGAYLAGENTDLCKVAVENCVLWCDWGKCLEVWAGNRPHAIRDISFRNNYLIHLSALAIDITTWFGSRDTSIMDIEFMDIHVNTDEDYEALQIQKSEGDAYKPRFGFTPQLIRINCDRLGDFEGSQVAGPKRNDGRYNLKYERLLFENIRCQGPEKVKLPVLIDAQSNPVEIRSVVLRSVDAGSISVLGKTYGISLE